MNGVNVWQIAEEAIREQDTMPKILVTWKKSGIGYSKDQRLTIESLGLRRLNHTVEHEDTASIRGMLRKVAHLVEISTSESTSEK